MFKSIRSFLPLTLLLALYLTPALAQEPTPLLTQPEDQLIATLQSSASLKEKMDACRELSVIGSRESIDPLAALLADEELSHMARYGLEPMPYPEVDRIFRSALRELTGRPLVGVIGSIGVRRDPKAVKALAARLDDSDADVAHAAARALGSIGTSNAANALQSALDRASDDNRLAIAEGSFRCAEQLQADGKRNAARRVYDRLRRESAPHQVRAGALRGAILLRGNGGLPLVRQGIQSQDLILVDAALRAAQELPGSEIVQTLADNLDGLPADNQVLVMQCLGLRADPAAIPALARLAKDGSTNIRLTAIHTLAEIGDSAAVGPLMGILRDDNAQIAQAAQESLASIAGVQADGAVRDLLLSDNKSDRLLGIELVSRRRMLSSMPALFAAAKDPDPQIRPAALRRLGEMGGAEDVPALLDLLARAADAADLEATEQALSALLNRLEDAPQHTPTLTARLDQAQPPQKAALVRLLGVVGGPAALEAVRTAVDDDNSSIRTTAIRTLSSWKTVEVAPELLALAKKAEDPTERTICLRGYLGWASNRDLPADQRLSMCREAASVIDQPDDKKLLLGALGRIQSPESLALIASYLDDDTVREEACAATVSIAEELLKGNDAPRIAPSLVAPLTRVTKASPNSQLIRKAQSLLQQAQDKTVK